MSGGVTRLANRAVNRWWLLIAPEDLAVNNGRIKIQQMRTDH
jgi:hypothetical protein